MIYIVVFRDDATADPGLRGQHMQAHLGFLERHNAQILAAGPLKTEAGALDGGLWLVEAEDVAAVEHLVRADPFWPTGLRHSHKIREWRQVFRDGERLV